jgi:hypothetical protein
VSAAEAAALARRQRAELLAGDAELLARLDEAYRPVETAARRLAMRTLARLPADAGEADLGRARLAGAERELEAATAAFAERAQGMISRALAERARAGAADA